jgi:hypothetical protein
VAHSQNSVTVYSGLVHRLHQLSVAADTAKRRLILHQQERRDAREGKQLPEFFKPMALVMTEALGDIAERLTRLNEILEAVQGQIPATQSGIAPRAQRSATRLGSRKVRSRGKIVRPGLRFS